ncbi:flavodoxin family protein [Dyella lutea]|uniref:Flavodoxin family protein n=1 Tax=Dyella lutea TaxID=2950441 RepID=A0ABT1FD48_9GAMM|nr:flavodoxin family protein [Dyella lutea]MCP1375264.1 flavodoxin family protein [Dyella lutea]
MKPRILLAYYSMTGHTRDIAEELRSALQADVEEIREPHPRRGLRGVLRALFDAVLRREPPIGTPRHDPAVYDLLAMGGPVWAGRMASPLRSYARQLAERAPRVAFFCTEGGRGAEQAFDDLGRLCGKIPEATLVVDAQHLPPGLHLDTLQRFVAKLGRERPTPGH